MKTLADHSRAYRQRRSAKLATYERALRWYADASNWCDGGQRARDALQEVGK